MKKNNSKYIIIMPNKVDDGHFIAQSPEMIFPKNSNLSSQKTYLFDVFNIILIEPFEKLVSL